jgi:hypothetical protein
MHAAYVKVRLLCERCTRALDLCVRVERNVPEPLACAPGNPVAGGTGGGGAGMCCGVCGASFGFGPGDLGRLVNDATRPGWGEHLRKGAVEIHCPA